MADSQPKYQMRMSLNVLNHLGLNLYSNIPAVLSEVVANAYDADAKSVQISIEESKIIIKDDGHGMSLSDINDKFLMVGYQRRENEEAISPELKRPVMGRKGIGKLSLFSIANEIEIHSTRTVDGKVDKNGLHMSKKEIERQIKENDGIYFPTNVPDSEFEIEKGTRIVITDFKKHINTTATYLRKRLAKRFSVLGDKYQFNVSINDTPVTIADRDFFKKIQFLWLVGDEEDIYSKSYEFEKTRKLNGTFDDGSGYKISGWIGTVDLPSDLQQDGVNNNKISIMCRGKMAQEDILETYTEGGIYADYLIGEIEADFLDLDQKEDIATSSRQKINEEDPRYRSLQTHIYKLLKSIQNAWTPLRKELNFKKALDNARDTDPALEEWYNTLKTDSRKAHAKDLFATIESFHFDTSEPDYKKKKKELYTQGIIAFEKLRMRDNLHELSLIKNADALKLSSIFSDLSDLEANLYYEIASERVEVIMQFQKKLDDNDKEKLLQEYLFDNLWILNPSWERPTQGTAIMEKRVESEFEKVVQTLSEDERKARLDIKYRTSAGKHIIIELKRYKPSYKITPFALAEQIDKYRKALKKCLTGTDSKHSHIEAFAIIGERFSEDDYSQAQQLLSTVNARLIYYDDLIQDSLQAYSDYLDQQKEVSKLRQIIDKIIDG